jgi:hypothetical protein
LNPEDTNYLIRFITNNDSNKRYSYKKSPGPEGFMVDFFRTIKEELVPLFLQIFQDRENDGILPNFFSVNSITLIPKPNKDVKKKHNFLPISLMNIEGKIINKVN